MKKWMDHINTHRYMDLLKVVVGTSLLFPFLPKIYHKMAAAWRVTRRAACAPCEL